MIETGSCGVCLEVEERRPLSSRPARSTKSFRSAKVVNRDPVKGWVWWGDWVEPDIVMQAIIIIIITINPSTQDTEAGGSL